MSGVSQVGGRVFQPAPPTSGSMWQWWTGMLLALLATANLFVPALSSSAAVNPTLASLMICSTVAFNRWLQDGLYVGRSHLLVFACSACFVPGAMFAGDNSYAASKVVGLFATAMMVLVSVQLLGTQRHRRAFVVALALFGCVDAVALYLFGVTENVRLTVYGLNPIGLGRMASLAALILTVAALHHRGGRRVGLIGLAVVVASASAATGSRGPLLSAVIAALLILAFNRSTGARVRGLVLAVVGLAVYYAVTNLVDEATASRLASTDSSKRVRIWGESLHVFIQHPFGIGFGNLYPYIDIDTSMSTAGYAQYSHNLLIEAAVEGGIPALVGLVVLLIVAFRVLRRGATDMIGEIFFGVFLFAVVGASLSSDLVGNRLVFVMIGAGLALDLLASQRAYRPDPARRFPERSRLRPPLIEVDRRDQLDTTARANGFFR